MYILQILIQDRAMSNSEMKRKCRTCRIFTLPSDKE